MTDKGTYDSRDKKVKISVLCLVVDKKKLSGRCRYMLLSIQNTIYPKVLYCPMFKFILFQKLLFYQAKSKSGQLSKQIRSTNLQN